MRLSAALLLAHGAIAWFVAAPAAPRALLRRRAVDLADEGGGPVIDVVPDDGGGGGGGFGEATFAGPRWRVVAAWARWERGGLVARMAAGDARALRGALAAAAPAAEAWAKPGQQSPDDGSDDQLLARLEVVEALLEIGADGSTCVAAFYAAGDGRDAPAGDPLVDEIFRLRAGLNTRIAVRAEDARFSASFLDTARTIFSLIDEDDSGSLEPGEILHAVQNDRAVRSFLTTCGSAPLQRLLDPATLEAALGYLDGNADGSLDAEEWGAAVEAALEARLEGRREERDTAALASLDKRDAVDAWLAIDERAAGVRRAAALGAEDARALLAELATTLVALRRVDPAARRAVALQAVHVHLPLGELLPSAGRSDLFSAAPYRRLLDEIEERSYGCLFPETYAHVRTNAARAAAVVGPSPGQWAAEARAAVAQSIANNGTRLAAFLGEDAAALARAPGGPADAYALDLPPATRVERRLDVEARVKSAASALRKMLGAGRKAVRDVLGVRVVVLGPDGAEAPAAALYAVRDALDALGAPLEGRAKDYVAYPKASGYRSLHATLARPDGVLVEAQVRSQAMHADATRGPSSHAAYALDRRDAALRLGSGARLALPPGAPASEAGGPGEGLAR